MSDETLLWLVLTWLIGLSVHLWDLHRERRAREQRLAALDAHMVWLCERSEQRQQRLEQEYAEFLDERRQEMELRRKADELRRAHDKLTRGLESLIEEYGDE